MMEFKRGSSWSCIILLWWWWWNSKYDDGHEHTPSNTFMHNTMIMMELKRAQGALHNFQPFLWSLLLLRNCWFWLKSHNLICFAVNIFITAAFAITWFFCHNNCCVSSSEVNALSMKFFLNDEIEIFLFPPLWTKIESPKVVYFAGMRDGGDWGRKIEAGLVKAKMLCLNSNTQNLI